MNILQEGIKIVAPEEVYKTLEISQGCEIAKGYSSVGIPYMTNAYRPRSQWRSVNEEELLLLKIDLEPLISYSSNIFIFNLPEVLKEKILKLKLSNVVSKLHFKKYYSENADAFSEVSELIKMYCSCFLQKDKEIIKTFYAINDSNLVTTTKYFKGKQYAGLHIDNLDGFSIDDTDYAQNRLCINLGTQTRYLLFINQPLKRIKDWLETTQGDLHPQSTQWHLGQRFFRAFGQYPIVRIPLKPFQIYIAPTENMLHDGSTLGNTAPDITYTALGHFSL